MPESAAPSTDFLELQSALAGEYSLQRELGRGGMGIVYLARDVQLDRDVAIKVLPAHLAQRPEARDRFLREARLAAGLSHPNIVPIHRVSEMRGFVFFVMSYVDGETLGERLRSKGPLPPADAMKMLREVSWALAYAHGRGVVHRDVKPDNILLEKGTGRALVTDFGIAYGGAKDVELAAGTIMGTLKFMSPEQAAGATVDGRSDLYALGVVGYVAVSGKLPFDSVDAPALLLKQATESAPSVTRVAPGLPPALTSAIDRCLDRDPNARFPDGEALAAALAPPKDSRPALPPTLRAWLAAKNPLTMPYFAWFGMLSFVTFMNVMAELTGGRGKSSSPWDILIIAFLAHLPIYPIIGFHLNQARRQFRAGHTLADLRGAIDVARREHAETEKLAQDQVEPRGHRPLRLATVGAATWMITTFGLIFVHILPEDGGGIAWIITPILATMGLGALANALEVRFVPQGVRSWFQAGIRDRLWKSRLGEWFARKLRAPERSQLAGASAFRATEAALGLAAAELFKALPATYQEQLAALPAMVEVLEARAAEARAEMEFVAGLAPSASADAQVLEGRRRAAARNLSECVAALEGIRLDLLKLHAGSGDLGSLTTLMDAVRVAGDDIKRLDAAQQEADAAMRAQRPLHEG